MSVQPSSRSSLAATGKVVAASNGLTMADGITGLRQTSHIGPTYGTAARKVEVVDGTSPRHAAKLDDAQFRVCVASRSDSVSDVAFPEGALEIEQHYYKGNILHEEFGEVDTSIQNEIVYRDVPVYKKEIEEVIKRETVVNQIVERVPKFNYIDNIVEVEHVIEKPVYKEVPVKKTVVKQVPKPVREQRLIEKVRYVPVNEEREVERIVEIPGEIVVQPRHVVRDEFVITDKHLDREVPVVVSQVVKPIMKDTKKVVRVPAKVLTPDLSTTEVRVPKPVELEFHQSEVNTVLKHVHLSDQDYNSAFFQLNQHLSEDHRKALRADHHIKIDKNTGYPVLRERNLKFYRLPETQLEFVEGYKSESTTSSSVSSSSTDEISKIPAISVKSGVSAMSAESKTSKSTAKPVSTSKMSVASSHPNTVKKSASMQSKATTHSTNQNHTAGHKYVSVAH